jgi:tetratricopeptide (TPR) repeat protein
LVKRALEYLDSLAAVSQNDVSLQSELASAYEKVGELQGNSSRPNLGDFTGAKESLLKANRIRQNLPKSVENLSLLAENYRILSDILFEQNETETALQDNSEAIKIYQELVAQNPDSENLRISFVKTLIDLGQLYQFTWKLDKSIEVSNQVKKETEKLDQNQKETQEIIATNLTDLGYSLSWNNQQAEAETEMAKAVEIVDSLAVKFPNDARTQRIVWRTYTQASAIYETIKDDISLKFAEKALESAINAVQNDASDFQAKHNLARAHYRKALCLNNLNKLSDALASLKTAQELVNELIEREPKNKVYQVEMARIYTNSGEIKFKQNNLEQALISFQESTKIREKILQSDPDNTNALRDLAIGFKNIGDIYLKLGSRDKAKAHYEKSLEIITGLRNNNTLSEVDNKLIEEITNKLAKL